MLSVFFLAAITSTYAGSKESGENGNGGGGGGGDGGSTGPDPCEGLADETLLDDPAGCPKYITCSGGKSVKNACPPGFNFNPNTKKCVFEEYYECTRCPADEITSIPISGSCTKYILCVLGKEYENECQVPLLFDPVAANCNYPNATECIVNRCPATEVDGEVTMYPNDSDCNIYYICLEGEPIEQSCPPTLHFDSINQRCDYPEKANCDGNVSFDFSCC